jgi:methylisocitrate lyase
MFIEDQVFPKRCGHMPGKEVISTQEMVAKIQSALDARMDPDFVIMARTDALAVHGIEEAIERMSIYREVGADLLFVEAPENEIQMKRICSELKGPCLANNIEAGATPVLNAVQLEKIGYALMTHPLAVTYAITHAVTSLMETIKKDGTTDAFINRLTTFDDFNEIVGLSNLRNREQTLLDKAQEKIQKKLNSNLQE